ncbi:HAD family hydrolase [Sphingomonas sp. RIT328]|uniref:HAD family hydrolase n=1 Tax=Sphingomonas sp. RIT328 TaxID=1470591 RepID=UPI00044804EB|nr:HAD family hydrolase [Sphingomonas sp. RIT328]EZP48670.1 Haloacid dehalogenase domain protein hydrolase [Sphingomonas sp. RIT328]
MIHTTVRPAALATLLADVPETIRVLSLDCFDTLLWRNVHQPVDIFTDLPLPGGLEARMLSEEAARQRALLMRQRKDVTLDDIYRQLLPKSQAEEHDAMIEAEMAAEARHGFIFGPTRDLIVDAKRRGLTVIIVSDTYLTETRLRWLIEQLAGPDLLTMIDHVFCSCDYGMGKSGGLFKPVIAALGVPADTILHVGDNPHSDKRAATEAGMHSAHLIQFDEVADDRLRLESCAAMVLDPSLRARRILLQAHRPQIALRAQNEPHFALGHDVLGPILHGFAVWLRDTAAAVERDTGKPAKLLFLMRDGYMPHRVFKTLFPEWRDRCASAEISRFVATAASFVDADAIEDYLVLSVPARNIQRPGDNRALTKQLLFTEAERDRLADIVDPRVFVRKMMLPANRDKIIKRSASMAERLRAHLRTKGVTDGDAIIFIDLGYNGTVQNAIEPMLTRTMKLDVFGRYFLLVETLLSGLNKEGLFDLSHFDTAMLRALYDNISLVEQMCTVSRGSVIDFKPNGTPIYADITLDSDQNARRDKIQDGCLAYMATLDTATVRPAASTDVEAWRRTLTGTLGRLLFLPNADEVAIFGKFRLDVNMGTKEHVPMLDIAAAEDGLRRRGLGYLSTAGRIFLEAELRGQGIFTGLGMMTKSRHLLDLRQTDFTAGETPLPVVLLDGGEPIHDTVKAYPTAGGFFRAVVPIGPRRYSVGVQFGHICSVVQVVETAFQRVDDMLAVYERARMIAATPVTNAMTEIAATVYTAQGREAFMLLPAPAAKAGFDGNLVLSIVFRPIAGVEASPQRHAA